MKQQFFKYVSQNVGGMIGISVYILADTFFISISGGANGITVLNLVLPLYGLIYAIGAMIGIGSATRHAIYKAQGEQGIDFYLTHSLTWQMIFSLPFILIGLINPGAYLAFMGGDLNIVSLGMDYVRIVFFGTPFFMMQFTFTAFARNDNAPTIAMAASLGGSLFNIIFDYVFMFPLDMGMAGAALATAMSPVVTILITVLHYAGKRCTLHIQWEMPTISRLLSCCQLGVSAFVGEIASAITTTVFNFLLLRIMGNIGVAAYGVVANWSLVVMSVFNGVAQGTQPLLSRSYGCGKHDEVKILLKLGLITNVIVEMVVILGAWSMTEVMVSLFNSEGNQLLAELAGDGMRFYFLGYLLAGVNIMFVTYFAATDQSCFATVASLLRGAVAITVCAVIMSTILGMNGVWLSFLASETITFGVVICMMWMQKRGIAYEKK